VIDVFTFAALRRDLPRPQTYGQLTNFNFDCVTDGIHKLGAHPITATADRPRLDHRQHRGAGGGQSTRSSSRATDTPRSSNVEAFSRPEPR
jgi:hypothetical protein